MRKYYSLGVVLILLLFIVGACAPTSPNISEPTDGTETTTEAPEHIVPLTVPGFDFIEKSDRVEPLFEGEQYSAYSFFVPKTNSQFHNKVINIEIWVHLFQDDVSSKDAFNALAGGGTSATEIQVNETKTILTYDNEFGESCAIQQIGKLVIYSDAWPPFDTITFDENALKDAAIKGLQAIRY